MTLQDFLGRLQGVKSQGEGHGAKCPAHDDRRQSLSVTTGRDDRLLLKCHAGCPSWTIVETLGLQMSDLFPEARVRTNGRGRMTIVAEYDYRDESGTLLYQTIRLAPKGFRQRRPNGPNQWIWSLKGVRLVVYRLDALMTNRPPRVFLSEGEKDVNVLVRLGLPATTSSPIRTRPAAST
jgi:putative DNA primase/helicase